MINFIRIYGFKNISRVRGRFERMKTKTLVIVLLPVLLSLMVFLTPVHADPGLQLDAAESINLFNPVFSWWEETAPAPEYMYNISDWQDMNGDGKLSSAWVGNADIVKLNGTSDQYQVSYLGPDTGQAITPNDGVYDMELLFIGPMPPRVPEFPLGFAMEIAFAAIIAYFVMNKVVRKPNKSNSGLQQMQ